MVRTLIRLSLSILLIVLSLPFLAVSFVVASIGAVVAAGVTRLCRQQRAEKTGLDRPRPADSFSTDPFCFDHAIRAYEDLLGGYAWKRP